MRSAGKPLVIDLFCGLGGWAEGFLAEGYDVIGFDIEHHDYGSGGYPGQLVLQDVLTLHGSQFRNAAVIVASPPCQFFSYTAMPWSRAKELAARVRASQIEYAKRCEPFFACFRIAREAGVPLIVENVRGAQPWVGYARYNYGSFYLWGDVPALMPKAKAAQKHNPDGTNHGQGSWFAIADSKNRGVGGGSWFNIGSPGQKVTGGNPDGRKVPSFRFDGSGGSFQTASVRRTDVGRGARFTTRDCGDEKGFAREWRDSPNGMPMMSSKFSARKAASAQIAKIPFPLASHIAKCFKP